MAVFTIEFVEYGILAEALKNPDTSATGDAVTSLEQLDHWLNLLLLPQVAMMVAVSLCWFAWLFNSVKLLHVAEVKGLEHSPWMAVIWNFIPIMQLWKPLFVNLEIADATQGNADWKANRLSKLALLCSLAVAIRAVVTRAYNQRGYETTTDVESQLTLDLATDALSILVFISAALFIRRMFHAQQRLVGEISAAAPVSTDGQKQTDS